MTKISTDPPAFRVRPAQPEEAGAFFAQTPEQYAQMGAIGCVRMDFGKRGTAFWHTWHPRGREELNSPEFKAELQQVVDTLRETVLKDLPSMRHFCYENGGKIPGGWSQNYGYVVETEHYEYCLRCNPMPGDYQAYLCCYDLNEHKINHAYDRDSTLAVIDTIKVRITERAKQHKETEVIFYDVSGLREAQKQLNAIVADNQIDITAPAHLYALVGESSVKAEFVNNSKNDTYKVEIRRNKDNALIADAFELAAGKSISTLTLLEAPEFGNVDCTVTIMAYRDGKQIGTLNTELTLHTAYLWPKEVQ